LEKTGLAAAERIAAQGLYENSPLLKYVNLVGSLVGENTELYYYPFRFYILADQRLAAYSTPNGMVFITKGLLDQLSDEAELACLLSHEITHVIREHGYKELLARKEMLIAEEAFEELDQEFPEEDTTFLELDAMALSMYEAATSRRQIKYEYEADQWGVIYAYRAGYDPQALVRVLKKIEMLSDRDFWNPESNWTYDALGDRIERVSKFIKNNLNRNSDWNVQNRSRFVIAVK
jgi:predicted Zn-dependent protease